MKNQEGTYAFVKKRKRPPCSAETKAKISAALTGRPAVFVPTGGWNKDSRHSPESIAKMRAAKLGKTMSQETCAKMSAAKKGKPKSEEHRLKMAAAQRALNRAEPNPVCHRSDGVTEIGLANGLTAFIDTEDWPLVSQYKWYPHAAKTVHTPQWYARTILPRAIRGKTASLTMHKLLVPDIPKPDHKDGNGLNNSRSNLRQASPTQNSFNSCDRPHSSQYRGVSWDKSSRKWCAQIAVNHKTIRVGRYPNERDAARVRLLAELVYYPDFIRVPH